MWKRDNTAHLLLLVALRRKAVLIAFGAGNDHEHKNHGEQSEAHGVALRRSEFTDQLVRLRIN